MKKIALALALWGLLGGAALAASATIYVDTGGCQGGSTTQCSGTTDSSSSTVSAAGATITCSATAGPSSTPGCSISGSPSLAGVATDGSQAIFLNCATNTNQKIFFIIAVDDTLKLVGTTGTPTGCTAATSDWGIGGRYIFPGTTTQQINNALRAGDTVVFNNTPAARTGQYFNAATAGDSTGGYINITGKTGVLPTLSVNGAPVLTLNQGAWNIQGLTLSRVDAGGATLTSAGGGLLVQGNKVTGGGTACVLVGGINAKVINNEVTGCGADGINVSGGPAATIFGNYVHGNTQDGIEVSVVNSTVYVARNIVSGNTARGIYFSAASTGNLGQNTVENNTVYNNGDSGIEVTDPDSSVVIINNILQENGNASGRWNVEWVTGSAEKVSWHGYNNFYHSNCQGSGTGGPACVSGLTVNATETNADSLFANAGSSNFAISAASPAYQTGFPGTILNAATAGFVSMGEASPASTGGGRPSCVGC